MPIYEYECTRCGKSLEAFQRSAEDPLKTCPHCNGALHKRISLSSFVLKGTGWYKTDYANTSQASPHVPPQHESKPPAQNGPTDQPNPKPAVPETKAATNGSN